MALVRFPGVTISRARHNSGPTDVYSSILGDPWVHLVKIWLLVLEVVMARLTPLMTGLLKLLLTIRVTLSHLTSLKLSGKLRLKWDVRWLRVVPGRCSRPVSGLPNSTFANMKPKGMSLVHLVPMSKSKLDGLLYVYSYMLSFCLYCCYTSDSILSSNSGLDALYHLLH